MRGARNKLSHKFIEALQEDFAAHGAETIKIARIERPVEYCKMVAGLLPKEFELVDNRLTDLTDDELEKLIEIARRQLITLNAIKDGEEEPLAITN